MRARRYFTAEEDERVLRARIDGATLTEIARREGRHRATVLKRLRFLAIRDEENDAW
jgi:DNA invertase Pin-like site-specific DNA recombinase